MEFNDYLEHHGVKGQQWGERNGPPYPLDEEGKADLQKQKKKSLLSRSKDRAKHSLRTHKHEKMIDKRVEAAEKAEKKKHDEEIKKHMENAVKPKSTSNEDMRQAIESLRLQNEYQNQLNQYIANQKRFKEITAKGETRAQKFVRENKDRLYRDVKEMSSKALADLIKKNQPKSAKEIMRAKTDELNAKYDYNEALKKLNNQHKTKKSRTTVKKEDNLTTTDKWDFYE